MLRLIDLLAPVPHTSVYPHAVRFHSGIPPIKTKSTSLPLGFGLCLVTSLGPWGLSWPESGRGLCCVCTAGRALKRLLVPQKEHSLVACWSCMEDERFVDKSYPSWSTNMWARNKRLHVYAIESLSLFVMQRELTITDFTALYRAWSLLILLLHLPPCSLEIFPQWLL